MVPPSIKIDLQALSKPSSRFCQNSAWNNSSYLLHFLFTPPPLPTPPNPFPHTCTRSVLILSLKLGLSSSAFPNFPKRNHCICARLRSTSRGGETVHGVTLRCALPEGDLSRCFS